MPIVTKLTALMNPWRSWVPPFDALPGLAAGFSTSYRLSPVWTPWFAATLAGVGSNGLKGHAAGGAGSVIIDLGNTLDHVGSSLDAARP